MRIPLRVMETDGSRVPRADECRKNDTLERRQNESDVGLLPAQAGLPPVSRPKKQEIPEVI
jgi:hypothetical protein